MATTPQFIFKSSAFPPEPGEDEEVNPGIFGKALANWLAAELPKQGYTVKGQVAEDFGRLVELDAPRGRLYVAASSTDETATEWQVFGILELGLFARLGGGVDPAQTIGRLAGSLRTILEGSPQVRELAEERGVEEA